MITNNSWTKFYNRDNNYIDYFKQRYKPFLALIPNKGIILEEGCGPGTVSKALNRNDIIQMDIDPMILSLAKNNNKRFIGDLRYNSTKKVDYIITHGVLEHLSHVDLLKIFTSYLLRTKHFIHYVPSNKYKTPSFGDERLMSKEYWMTFNITVIEFNDGFDLLLIK